ncbi:MAG: putative selenate reductase subunit YgfK [Synergistaceae bacterium]|nr:putative selenate reductase subunit YgfK [Synergistaceae bacterium]
MSDRMRPFPFAKIMEWILSERERSGRIFGVSSIYRHKGSTFPFLGEKIENPFGPAAGPHTQLAQNIVSAYSAGARFFELKTVQALDGEDLKVSKPCIDARDECYNVEWSTELTVKDAFDEYVKAWIALKLISQEFHLGAPDGFMFNMSVGYDLEGISSAKIDGFIEGLKCASGSAVWSECMEWCTDNVCRFRNIDRDYIEKISPKVCSSITLSTLHGCPPDEIERIALYLISKKHLNTFVKINPTIIGYQKARETLDHLGFSYISFNDRHFREDLQLRDAVPMIGRLLSAAEREGLTFGAKLTNTLPVDNPGDVMQGDERYMSGRALFPLTALAAGLLAEEFEGKLPLSWSGGADFTNALDLAEAGIRPVTMATGLLKPGGYNRLKQIAETFSDSKKNEYGGISQELLHRLISRTDTDEWYRKPVKQRDIFEKEKELPLADCFMAPCIEACPIHQDVPEYTALTGEGRYAEALELILDKNPLPFTTGTICTHRCMASCTRNHYEEPVKIREVKLKAAEKGFINVIDRIGPAEHMTGTKAAVIGGGPAGLAAAYFLQRYGINTTIFERESRAGGVVQHIIPDFRIKNSAIESDIEIVKRTGAEMVIGTEISSLDELWKKGYRYIVIAAGASKHQTLEIESEKKINALDFLASYKKNAENLRLGTNVAVIGGGNTAMDSARAALRIRGVQTVSVVYRRTAEYMPAEEEELRLAMDSGVIFRELMQPILHRDGNLLCSVITLGDPDASGRRSPAATAERASVPADVIIEAVGESVDTDFFNENNILTDSKGRAVTDEKSYETNIKNVYVAGDARTGPGTVVEAIADARRVSDDIAFKEGLRMKQYHINDKTGHDLEIQRSKKGRLIFCEEIDRESKRCLECGILCENCVDVCPNRANVEVMTEGSASPQIVHIDAFCNECGNCSAFCPWKGSPYKDKFTFFSNEKDFCESQNSGFAEAENGKFKIRLENKIFVSDFDFCDSEVPAEIAALIKAAVKTILL